MQNEQAHEIVKQTQSHIHLQKRNSKNAARIMPASYRICDRVNAVVFYFYSFNLLFPSTCLFFSCTMQCVCAWYYWFCCCCSYCVRRFPIRFSCRFPFYSELHESWRTFSIPFLLHMHFNSAYNFHFLLLVLLPRFQYRTQCHCLSRTSHRTCESLNILSNGN